MYEDIFNSENNNQNFNNINNNTNLDHVEEKSFNKKSKLLFFNKLLFRITSIIFFILGPLPLFLAFFLGEAVWIIPLILLPYMARFILFIECLISLSYIILLVFAKKNNDSNMYIISVDSLYSSLVFMIIIIMLLLFYNIILMAVVIILSYLIIKIVHRHIENNIIETEHKTIYKISFLLTLLLFIISISYIVFYFVQNNDIIMLEKNNEELKMMNKEGIPSRLSNMVISLCDGDYDVVYQSKENKNAGIFECNESHEVYSVEDKNKRSGFSKLGIMAYYGKTKDEIVEKYFPNKHYFYADYDMQYVDDDFVLLLEENSKEELIENNIDNLYNFIEEKNKKYKTYIDIKIFYNNSLNAVKNTLDIVALKAVSGVYTGTIPVRSTSEYSFYADPDQKVLMEIGKNNSLYSRQTRNAIKNNEYIDIVVKNGQTIKKEELYRQLQSSWKKYN